MPTAFLPVITSAGVAAALAADGNALQLKITHVVLGSGAYTPTGAETALASRKEKALVSGGAITGPSQVTVQATFRSSAYSGAPYNIGEIGFYAGDPDAGGVLFAVASAPGANFGERATSSVIEFLATFVLNLSGVPTGSVTVLVDPNAGAAYMLLAAHNSAPNPHPMYVRKVGDVMTGALTLHGNATSALHSVPLQQLASMIADVVPVGTVVASYFPPLSGSWVKLDGSLFYRADYPEVVAKAVAAGIVATEAAWAAGSHTKFGAGDGSTSMRWPDLRGEWIRGLDGGRGINPGRGLATWQDGMVKKHKHVMAIGEHLQAPFGSTVTQYNGIGMSDNNNERPFTNDGSDYDGQAVNPAGVMGDEQRVRGVALPFWMKASSSPMAATSLPPDPTPPPPPPPPPPPMNPPVANFIGGPSLSGDAPLAVSFTDTSTGAPTSWLWDFGDGDTSTAQNPAHTYSYYGLFNVSLTATNAAGGNTKTRFNYVYVVPPYDPGGGA